MSKTLNALKTRVGIKDWCQANNTTEFNLRRLLSGPNPTLSAEDCLLLLELVNDGLQEELRQDGYEPELFKVIANFARLSLEAEKLAPMWVTNIEMPIQQIFALINDCCGTEFVAKYFLSTDPVMHGLIYVLDRNAKQFMIDILNTLLPLYEFYMETSELILIDKK